MKILFVGDASNFHNTLACALRELGHETAVVSDGGRWMNTSRDMTLVRNPGTIGAVRYVLDIMKLLPKMRNFDIVHIVSPIFLDLKPEKVRLVFDYLKRNNRHIFLSALGSDYEYVRKCMEGKVFRYSEFKIGDKTSPYLESSESYNHRDWLKPFMKRHFNYISRNIDGVIACLYEYYISYLDVVPDKLCYGGIPINTKEINPHYIDCVPAKVRFFIGMQQNRKILKGTDRLLTALKRLQERRPDECEICVVENMPYNEYVEKMQSSHVVIDQLYSYTPATNALIAMARGLVAVSGAEPEYYDLIKEYDNHPIINVLPFDDDAIVDTLEQIVIHRDRLPQLSKMSREFVVKHNDSYAVAMRHINFWDKIICSKKQ